MSVAERISAKVGVFGVNCTAQRLIHSCGSTFQMSSFSRLRIFFCTLASSSCFFLHF